MGICEDVTFPVDQETRTQAKSFRLKRNGDLKGNDIQYVGKKRNSYWQEVVG